VLRQSDLLGTDGSGVPGRRQQLHLLRRDLLMIEHASSGNVIATVRRAASLASQARKPLLEAVVAAGRHRR
jgi:hypothetical protein